jgi:serine/threonine-protein kinase
MSKICPVCGNTYSDANAFCPSDGTTLRAAEVTADLIGSVVADRYLVTDLLGEGGMGKVYLARHVRLPQQAAIKVLRPAMLKDAAAVARFNREAANASRIDHDRVARVYDFGEAADGTVYLAMEYVPGRTLKRLITDTGALEPRRAAGLVRQIAEGLDAAHRLGIVHRDLKPDNIMVVEDGDGAERVKVVDFGIAKALGADEGGQGLTQAGYVVGTPEYMSPEQLLGGQIDARSDVYALAIIAYQCLTGSFPFDTSTPERVMASRLTEQPRTLAHAQPAMTWPASVQAVLDAGLARDVEHRPPSAGAFARALCEAVEEWMPAGPGVRALATPRAVPMASAPPPAAVPAPAPPPRCPPGPRRRRPSPRGARRWCWPAWARWRCWASPRYCSWAATARRPTRPWRAPRPSPPTRRRRSSPSRPYRRPHCPPHCPPHCRPRRRPLGRRPWPRRPPPRRPRVPRPRLATRRLARPLRSRRAGVPPLGSRWTASARR